MATGRLTIPSENAVSAAPGHHRVTTGRLYLLPHLFRQPKPDEMIRGAMTGLAKTGTVTTGDTKTNAACRLHRLETGMTTRIRMPLMSSLSASATTSTAGTSNIRR